MKKITCDRCGVEFKYPNDTDLSDEGKEIESFIIDRGEYCRSCMLAILGEIREILAKKEDALYWHHFFGASELYYQARKDAIEDACPACNKSIKECKENNKYLDCIDKTFYGTDLEYINTKGGFCLKCTWKFIGELSEIFLYPDCDDEYIKEQMEQGLL